VAAGALVGAWELGQHGEVPALTTTIGRSEPGVVLFLGDLHLDSPKSDRRGLRRVLDEAVARGAAVVLLGDTFDAMQGKLDRRSSKSALRERYSGRDDYLGALLEDVGEFLLPYARNLWLLLDGNHEHAITRFSEISLTKLLAHQLNQAGGHVLSPGYQTYATLRVRLGSASYAYTVPFYVTHGSGGSSPVTGGVIGAQRRAVTYPDATFVVSGHLHSDFYKPFVQHRLSAKGKPYNAKQRHLQVSAWKNEHGNSASWAAERGFPPGVPSGWWLEVRRAPGENPTPAWSLRFYEAE
jgi:hypothetical protein